MSAVIDVMDALIRQIHQYLPKIPVIQNNVIAKKPPYPYITIDVVEPYIQTEYRLDSANFNMRTQIKIVADDKRVYFDLLERTRFLFTQNQVNVDLYNNEIGVLDIQNNPSTADYLDNLIVYDGGFDLLLNVYHKIEDMSQGNKPIDNININFKGE